MPVTLFCFFHCKALLGSKLNAFSIFTCIKCNINIAWIFALCLLACRLFSPSFNKLTSYGKLASYPVSNILPNRHYFQTLMYPRYKFLTQKRVFTFIYTFSFFWALLIFFAILCILLRYRIMGLDFQHTSNGLIKKQKIPVKEFGKSNQLVTLKLFSIQTLGKIALVINSSAFIKRATLQTFLVLAHLGRRSLECIYVHRFSLRHLSLGNTMLMWVFYIVMPITLLIDLVIKCLDDRVKDELLKDGELMGNNTTSFFLNWKIIFSVALWMWSSYEQNKAHRILSHLRSKSHDEKLDRRNIQELEEQARIDASVSKQLFENKIELSTEPNNVDCRGYPESFFSIPKGAMFNLVLCPHYLFEIIIYFSFLLIAGWAPSASLMFIFITITMVSLSSETHCWYKKKFFGDPEITSYLKNRKTLIPYIW